MLGDYSKTYYSFLKKYFGPINLISIIIWSLGYLFLQILGIKWMGACLISVAYFIFWFEFLCMNVDIVLYLLKSFEVMFLLINITIYKVTESYIYGKDKAFAGWPIIAFQEFTGTCVVAFFDAWPPSILSLRFRRILLLIGALFLTPHVIWLSINSANDHDYQLDISLLQKTFNVREIHLSAAWTVLVFSWKLVIASFWSSDAMVLGNGKMRVDYGNLDMQSENHEQIIE